jgi:7-cyano-7-deazaguanine synthase
MDSTTLAYWLREKDVAFVPLFVDYGQHCARKEYRTLVSVLPPQLSAEVRVVRAGGVYEGSTSRLIQVPDLWRDAVRDEDLYLPYRNLLLLCVGAAFAQANGCSDLYAAFINSNHAKEIDCSAEFFERLGTMLSDYGTVRVQMPFRHMTKTDVARLGLSLNAPIARTFSCQTSPDVPCGACPNCVDRLEALRSLGQ